MDGEGDRSTIRVCCTCLDKVIPINAVPNSVTVCQIEESNKTVTCSLCCGILQSNGSLLEAVFRCVNEFQIGGYKQFFVSIHVPDVVYLNYFLWDKLSNDDKQSNGRFYVDAKSYPVKDYFKDSLCDALNSHQPNTFIAENENNLNGPTLNVVLIAPCPNTYSFLVTEKACKPSAKKMRLSLENGKDIDRNCFTASVNSILQQQYLSSEEISSLLFKSSGATKQGHFQFQLSVHVPSMFIGGRYLKFSRTLSQTPWFINGKRKGSLSVEELISQPLKDLSRCHSSFFRSSGREDIDVKMLGHGRPFVVELVQPRVASFQNQEMENIQRVINTQAASQIEVRFLNLVPKEDLIHLRDGETEKSKEYIALLFCKETPFSASDLPKLKLFDLSIIQKTPLRVLHRRSLLERKRTILWSKPSLVENNYHYLKLDLATEAGTYIKEWVHGDLGRTKPSLSDILGRSVDIVQLDVANVNLEWPLKK